MSIEENTIERGSVTREHTEGRMSVPAVDYVNRPPHYGGNIECIEAIEASMTKEGFEDYCKGNIIKYLWRWRKKGGVEDLKKAKWYLNRMIGELENAE